jgi:hypothetical protein
MTVIQADMLKPIDTFSALEVLTVVGYDPDSPKVKRAAQYFELWREMSIESARKDRPA